MQDLIKEYKKSLRLLRSAKAVPVGYNSMISDTLWSIHIMETGNIPGKRWTVARWQKEDREIPIDPMTIAECVGNQRSIEPTPEWMVDYLEDIMKNLTKREKEAYRLVRGEKFSFSQAASFMGCNKATAQTFVRRAEKKIQLVIRKQVISEGVCQV